MLLISVFIRLMQLWGFTTGDFCRSFEGRSGCKTCTGECGRISLTEDNGVSSITLPEGMEIDLGGIAKGYTSGRVMEVMKRYGIESAVINLGGNAHVLGSKPDGSAWKVGIQDPNDTNGYLGGVSVRDKAIITSGGYERYFVDEATGVKYHHIIDPKTGYSANNGLISVTLSVLTVHWRMDCPRLCLYWARRMPLHTARNIVQKTDLTQLWRMRTENCILPMASWMILSI